MKSEPTVPLIQLDPWRAPEQCEPPEALRPWLLEADSMTRRLRRHHRQLSVQLLANRSVPLAADEQALVAADCPQGLCREVILHGDGGPAILGWTLYAEAALPGSGLQNLGEQPLGERIFGSDPTPRDNLLLARFEIADNPCCPAAIVWGRRSRLYLGPWPLLVHELFLPSLLSHSPSSSKEPE